MKTKLFLAFFCLVAISFAQTKNGFPNPKYPELFKTLGTPIKDSDPEWVRLMYSKNPNFFKIKEAYDKYYSVNLLKKTTHTQNYKHFYRIVSQNHYYTNKGDIFISEEEGIQEQKSVYPKSTLGTNWSPVAPIQTIALDNGGVTVSAQVNVYAMAQSSSNPNVLFCSTETGAVFKSVDKGLNWIEVGADIFQSNAQAIKIDPTDENIVYIALNRDLYKTTNGGQTWNVILNTSYQYDIEINYANTNILYLAGNFGLKRSADAGQTWTDILTDKVTDIEFKSDDPSTVFAAKYNTTGNYYEIWKSMDNGLSFEAKITGWFTPTNNGKAAHAQGAKIANTKADGNRLYVLLLGSDVSYAEDLNYLGVYRSDDAGETWTLPYDGNGDGQPDNNPGGPYSCDHWAMSTFNVCGGSYDQGFYNADIDVSDTNADEFLVGMLNLFRSSDGGVTFKVHGGYGCSNCKPYYRHPDQQDILIQGNDVWVCSDGGIDYYGPDLEIIESRMKGITTCELWGFDQGWNEDVLVGGRYHNGNMAYHENYENGTTIRLGGGESATGFVNLGENRKVYHDDIGGKLIPETLQGNVTSIPNFSKYPKSGNSLEKSEIVNDPRWWNNVYLGSENKLWKSEDYGKNYELLKEFGIAGNTVRGIEISRANPAIMFVNLHVGASVKLYKTVDSGVTWEELNLPIYSHKYTLSLNAENELFIAFDKSGNSSQKVYKSTDLGENWENLSTDALNGIVIRDIEVQDGTDGGVYVFGSREAFYKNNTMADWVNISSGLPKSFRLLDAKLFYKKSKIRMAGNRGVWERDFYELSKPKAQPMVSHKEAFCNREEIQFEDYSILDHTNATWEWEFPGAQSVSSTTVRNPKVTYATPGEYDVTLTITNPQGTSTKTIQNIIKFNRSLCSPQPSPEKAVVFTGENNQYLTTSPKESIQTDAFTFTGWIKPNGIQPNYSSVFFIPGGPTLDFKNSKNELGTHSGGLWWYNSGLVVPKDKWSYVALIYTTSKVTLVLNEKTYEINRSFNSLDIKRIDLGIHNLRNDRKYKGMLDEATFWNRALTLDEIRAQRHLTKPINMDAAIFAYYQFNDINGSNVIYDVKGSNDLSVINNAIIEESTCPVGPGVSQKMVIDGNHTVYDFDEVKLRLTTGANNFNGAVYASKINLHPNIVPEEGFEYHKEYYIIDNYGAESTIGTLDKLELYGFDNLDPSIDYNIYKRERNTDEEWTLIGATDSSENQIAVFNTIDIANLQPVGDGEPQLNSATQLMLKSTAVSTLSSEGAIASEKKIVLYPNLSSQKDGFAFKNIGERAVLSIFDVKGKAIYKSVVKENQRIKAIQKAGVYFYTIMTKDKIQRGKIITK
ncbi:VPS10 domain-containing protein [Tenacibaculum maritimum]|uniref:VPS10 domain-containing protein n=1 Tax=Tenacibaculum maritimum TaxID=107401 RepID=UPI0038768E12